MTISATTNRTSYTGNGSTKDFAFAAPYRAPADLLVYLRVILSGAETLQALSTNYSLVSAVPDASTGGFTSVTIRFVTAPTSLQEVHIVRRVAPTTAFDPTAGGSLPSAPLEGAVDRISLALQGAQDYIDRSIRAKITDAALSALPSSSTRASKVLAFDSAGQPTVSTLTLADIEAANIGNASVTNAKLANVATATIKGRVTAGTGSPEDLSGTQATSLLVAFTGDSGAGGAKGLVPAPAIGDSAKFLRGDGAWAAGAGGGSGAPTDADYLVKTANGGLSVERVVTDTATVAVDWATAGQAKFGVVAASIGNTQLRTGAAISVVGRSANSIGALADIAAGSDDTILRRTGSALDFGQLTVGMVPDALVTFAKIQNVSATDKVLGRSTAGAGVIEEIAFTATARSLVDDTSTSAMRTTLGLAIGTDVQAWDTDLDAIAALTKTKGNLIAANGTAWVALAIGTDGFALQADSASAAGVKWAAIAGGGAPTTVEYLVGALDAGLSAERLVTDTATVSWDLATGGAAKANVVAASIGNTQLRTGAALTVIGRSANSTGSVADIAAVAASGSVLRESGSTIGFGTIATAGITDAAVTYAKIQNISATNTLLGRKTAGAGVTEEIVSSANILTFLQKANLTAGFDYLSPGTTKGDLLVVNNALNNVRLGIGTDGQVLTASAAAAEGMAWATPSGGGGGAPTTASYLTLGTDATLSAERVLTAGAGITLTDAGAGSTLTVALNISGLTSFGASPVGADSLALYDSVNALQKRITLANLINNTAPTTAPVATDQVGLVLADGTTWRKSTIGNLFNAINTLTADASPDGNADYVVGYKTGSSAPRKVLHRDLRVLEAWTFSVGPENSGVAAGANSLTFRAPYAFQVTDVHLSSRLHSASYNITADIAKGVTSATATTHTGGTSIFTTAPNMGTTTLTSVASTPAVMVGGASSQLAADQWCGITTTFAATATTANNAGTKVTVIGYRV